MQVSPPVNGSNNPATVNGTVYNAGQNPIITVPDTDGLGLIALGWLQVTARAKAGFPVGAAINSLNMMKWRSARQLKSRNARIACIGDSTVDGIAIGGDGNQRRRSWPSQLAQKLKARGIPAGANNRFGAAGGSYATANATDNRITPSGAWGLQSTPTAGGNATGVSTGAAGSQNFLPDDAVGKFDVYWRDGAVGRNFTMAIDGGATTAVNSSGSTQIFKTSIVAGSVAAHTLNLAWVLGSITILGIDSYDTSRFEISVWNWGISGARSDQVADNSDTLTGRMAMYANPLTVPDLAIIEGGVINDWRQGITSVAASKANITSIVTLLKPLCSVVLYTPRFDNSTSGFTASQEDYVTAVRQIAVEQGVELIDGRTSFGSFAIGNAAGFYSDTVHGDIPGIGYGDEADTVIAALLSF